MVEDRHGRQLDDGWPFPPLLAPAEWRRVRTRYGLTPREAEVVACLCRGVDYAATCARLGIRLTTLKTLAHTAYGKIGCRARVELILTLVHGHKGLA